MTEVTEAERALFKELAARFHAYMEAVPESANRLEIAKRLYCFTSYLQAVAGMVLQNQVGSMSTPHVRMMVESLQAASAEEASKDWRKMLLTVIRGG